MAEQQQCAYYRRSSDGSTLQQNDPQMAQITQIIVPRICVLCVIGGLILDLNLAVPSRGRCRQVPPIGSMETSFPESCVVLYFIVYYGTIRDSSTPVLCTFPTSSLLVLARKRERGKMMNVCLCQLYSRSVCTANHWTAFHSTAVQVVPGAKAGDRGCVVHPVRLAAQTKDRVS
jgi:hypothetical protein